MVPGEGGVWAREWERFAQGFGAVGAAWGSGRADSERTGSEHDEDRGEDRGSDEGDRRGDRYEFEHALRDFSVKVRDMVRGAGQVGESATHDLRRILDDTVEVIRRDMGRWGPSDQGDDGPRTAGTGATGPEEPRAEGSATEEPEPESPGARPMPPSGGDPWAAATGEDDQADDQKKD